MKALAMLPVAGIVGLAALWSSHVGAQEITIAFGAGFTDDRVAVPVEGNRGTTVGAQRINAVNAAKEIIESALDIQQEVTISVAFENLDCDAESAVLGSAGAVGYYGNFPGAPLANTWYPVALANELSNSDLNGALPEVAASFNADLGEANCAPAISWYYGTGTHVAREVDFIRVILHEIVHGLGFATLVNASGAFLQGAPDVYSTFMRDVSVDLAWPDMTQSQRAASAIDASDLVWSGSNVAADQSNWVTDENGLHVTTSQPLLHAPTTYESGSSNSHWHTSFGPALNLLMEPFSSPNQPQRLDLATALLQDLGWTVASDLVANGDSCTAGSDCASGFCADGVCCATACGGGATTDCQACALALNGVADGTCSALSSGTSCGDLATECTNQDTCDGAGTCTDNAFKAPGTSCGDAGTECTNQDTCDGAGSCNDNGFKAFGNFCGDAGTECTNQDTCDGAGSCNDNAFKSLGTSCGAAATECTEGDSCDAAGVCLSGAQGLCAEEPALPGGAPTEPGTAPAEPGTAPTAPGTAPAAPGTAPAEPSGTSASPEGVPAASTSTADPPAGADSGGGGCLVQDGGRTRGEHSLLLLFGAAAVVAFGRRRRDIV